ncbi:MAG: hypothetical protein ACRDAM_04200 [Casimicrobium sp.]
MKYFPLPTGSLLGDTSALPDRGTSEGVTDTYGADVSGEATNRIGSIASSSKSTPAMERFNRQEK